MAHANSEGNGHDARQRILGALDWNLPRLGVSASLDPVPDPPSRPALPHEMMHPDQSNCQEEYSKGFVKGIKDGDNTDLQNDPQRKVLFKSALKGIAA